MRKPSNLSVVGPSATLIRPNVPVQVGGPPGGATSPATLARLQAIRALLASMGVTDLSSLGSLPLPGGTLLVQRGLVVPPAAAVPKAPAARTRRTRALVPFAAATHLTPMADGGLIRQLLSGTARPFAAELLPQFRQPFLTLSIFDALWVATSITLDNTTVILVPPGAMSLLIIAQTIIIGNNVQFTWARPPFPALNKNFLPGQAPPTPPQVPPTLTPGQAGDTGMPGIPGANGDSGSSGTAGPAVEMWTLNLTGALLADLAGQDGQAGGRGQDGGTGGQGGVGGVSSGFGSIFHACPFGPGSGGNGGPGGAAGAGGAGGSGAAGGQFALYAPQAVLDSHPVGGPSFQANTDGGLGGVGAGSGNPGSGGPGGALGPWANFSPPDLACAHNTTHTAGAQGPAGAGSVSGLSGQSGSAGMVTTNSITAAEFQAELNAPAISALSAYTGHVGDSISLTGLNLQNTDTVLVAGAPAATTVQSDTTASFVVPDVAGGLTDVVVRQVDGTQSNPAAFAVLPSITGATADRVKNGAFVWRSTVTLTGTGFAPSCRVQVNGADEPASIIDTHTITFTITPPASLTPAESGETVAIRVLLSTGQASDPFVVPVATCRIVVIGDSVLWGEGLLPAPPAMKISDLVLGAIAAQLGDVDTFVDLLAHCGAVITGGTGSPAASSEVPDPVPTIIAQVAAISDPVNVDLVLVDGGINDIGITTILDPTTTPTALSTAIMAACSTGMTGLLNLVIRTCPNAQIVVTSYYPILSPASDTSLIPLLATFIGGIPLGIAAALETFKTISNCMSFFAQSSTALSGAVGAANAAAPKTPPAGLLASPGRSRVAFAAPPFTNDNATLAPNAWLFGINGDGTTQDPMAPTRHVACAGIRNLAARTICDYGSVGHPNQLGAQQYADAIILALRSQLVTFTGTATITSASSNASGPMTTPVTGPLALDDTDGAIVIPAFWSVSTTVSGIAIAGTLGSVAGSPGSFPPGSFIGAAASIPAALALSIAGPLGTQLSSGQVTLTTGGPVSAGTLAPVTGSPTTSLGLITLVAAGQLSGGYISGAFTLVLTGTLAPIPT